MANTLDTQNAANPMRRTQPFNTTWPNVLTTYVNRNCNSTVSQDWVTRTLNFDGAAVGMRTLSRTDVWTTSYNMEFKNTVWDYATGRTSIEDVNGGRRFCSGHWGEHTVITKNSGEPFSIVGMKVGYHGENSTLTIKGYSKGSSTVKQVNVAYPSTSGTQVNLNWDGLIKVEIRGPQGHCIDDLVIKTLTAQHQTQDAGLVPSFCFSNACYAYKVSQQDQSAQARVLDVGLLTYAAAWDLQKQLLTRRQNDEVDDTLILVEHPEVVTLGRGSHAHNILAVEGIDVFEVERGGDVTYHGPGQLVGYPIFKLREDERDLHRFLRNMEEGLIFAAAQIGLATGRNPGWTGVWTEAEPRRKLASMGVACRKWVTFHGFALNVCTDLTRFDVINPCGLQSTVMGSLTSELGRSVSIDEVKSYVIEGVGRAFARRWEP